MKIDEFLNLFKKNHWQIAFHLVRGKICNQIEAEIQKRIIRIIFNYFDYTKENRSQFFYKYYWTIIFGIKFGLLNGEYSKLNILLQKRKIVCKLY